MSFSMLPKEIKVHIFNMLSISNRYNASLVWKEMTFETWRFIPTIEELTRKLTVGQNMLSTRKMYIQNVDDLETAGVLASAGNLEPLEDSDVYIEFIDVTNVPINIFNSLAKVVNHFLYLNEVTGLNLSMLKNLNFDKMWINNMPVPAYLNQDISVNGEVRLANVSGDISELLRSARYEIL